ncbi:MAG: serpin family protein [Planctomycetota bacterium]
MKRFLSILITGMLPLAAQPSPDLSSFAFRLLEQAAPNGNACLSPWSLATALAMAEAGAGGETKAEMATALGFADADAWRALAKTRIEPGEVVVHEGGKNVKVPAFELLAANAAWASAGQAFAPAYLERLERDFGAPLQRVDFTADRARQEINAWVAEQTKKRIPELFAPGSPARDSKLALVNAVYLNASWATAFPRSATRDADFHLDARDSAKVATMQLEDDLDHCALRHCRLVSLPYRGHSLAMVVAVPDEIDGAAAAAAELQSRLAKVQWSHGPVRLHLPRFELTEGYSLGSALGKLGMEKAFDKASADFSGMTGGRDLYVSAVVQKTFFKVDEKATEAAAATGVVLGPTSAAIPQPRPLFVVRADRPFFFVVHDRKSGAILFVGRVSDPR